MKISLHHCVVASFGIALVSVGLFAYPSFAVEAGLDFWNVPHYQDRLRAGQRLHDDLDRKDKIVLERTMRKVELLHELLAGLWTFDEATDRMEAIHRALSTGMPSAGPERGRTEREKAAFRLIRYLRSACTPEATALADKHERELLAVQ